jgi:hypothetical protein
MEEEKLCEQGHHPRARPGGIDPRPHSQDCVFCGMVRTEDVHEQENGRLGWFWGEWKLYG